MVWCGKNGGILKRSICIYVEKDYLTDVSDFYDISGDAALNLKDQGLHNLCTRCVYRGECVIKNKTSFRLFSKKETSKYVKW